MKSILILSLAALSLAAHAEVQVYRDKDGALVIYDANPGVKGPAPKVDPLVSPHATCTLAVNKDIGMGVRGDRCAVWTFSPSKRQQAMFGQGL